MAEKIKLKEKDFNISQKVRSALIILHSKKSSRINVRTYIVIEYFRGKYLATHDLHISTFKSMVKRGLIEKKPARKKESYFGDKFGLTEKGKQVAAVLFHFEMCCLSAKGMVEEIRTAKEEIERIEKMKKSTLKRLRGKFNYHAQFIDIPQILSMTKKLYPEVKDVWVGRVS